VLLVTIPDKYHPMVEKLKLEVCQLLQYIYN